MTLPSFFEEDRRAVDEMLGRLLPPEDAPPSVIHRAMRYSVFAGGKRVRPMLCLESARIFSCDPMGILPVACAFEFIHTYSLIHDDLPALDNDDLRRGRPTCHKEFGEAMAILAGDALLTLAFEALACASVTPALLVPLIAQVAAAIGTRDGMVGGQVADLEAEGQPVTPEMLEYIHRSKTAALIRASIVAGAIGGGASESDIARLHRFGDQIGWAFQVTDDILDVEESSATLGKTAGKDQAQQKATYPALFGLEESRNKAQVLLEDAHKSVQNLGPRSERLKNIARFLIERQS